MPPNDLRFLMASVLLGAAPPPDVLYLGLTLDREFSDMTLAAVSRREISSPNYARGIIARASWSVTRNPPAASAMVEITNKSTPACCR